MRGSPWQYVSKLKQVFHLSGFRAPHDGIDIVVIPGLWVHHTVEKESKRCSWLKILAASTDYDTRVFIFKYDIEPGKDGSVWHPLLGLSRVLLDALRQARPCESQKRPLYFICHSLGGIILKQALYLAHHSYPAIRNALSGIIFLATPHLTSIDDERWEKWRLILKAFQRNVPKTALGL
ncbi:uncharacterized protein LY89DRAFT_152069 [Mollisia scopiformis]|uniref:Uncharacterized protein n=1 Tax=Mollisia scopiformis TaxID=149040 RepID=A0A194X209_MOLSC|nr:uncharacterized protein LY89DRAFT_152069 [Mollisia scopiformis]KUJ14029.1 hypothetical protein LY89DRAFT_152069 [Mollisia scopiformis]